MKKVKSIAEENLSHYTKKEFLSCYRNNEFYIPKFIKFKLTNKCNLRCQKCNYWRDYRLKRDADVPSWELDEIKNIIKQLAEIKTEIIKFSGGEITLIKELPQILDFCNKLGVKTSITSNGTMIDEQMADQLVSSGLNRLTISLDSYDEKEHDEFVGMNGAWARTTQAFLNIYNAKKKHNSRLDVTLACVVYHKNVHDLHKIIELAQRLKLDKVNFLTLVDHHLDKKDIKVTEKQINEFNKTEVNKVIATAGKYNIKIVNKYFWGQDNENNNLQGNSYDFKAYDYLPCFIPWTHFVIDFRGYLFPCCFTKQKANLMGDIRKDKIKDILNSQKYKNFRKLCKPPILREQCRRCNIEIQRNTKINNLISSKL